MVIELNFNLTIKWRMLIELFCFFLGFVMVTKTARTALMKPNVHEKLNVSNIWIVLNVQLIVIRLIIGGYSRLGIGRSNWRDVGRFERQRNFGCSRHSLRSGKVSVGWTVVHVRLDLHPVRAIVRRNAGLRRRRRWNRLLQISRCPRINSTFINPLNGIEFYSTRRNNLFQNCLITIF